MTDIFDEFTPEQNNTIENARDAAFAGLVEDAGDRKIDRLRRCALGCQAAGEVELLKARQLPGVTPDSVLLTEARFAELNARIGGLLAALADDDTHTTGG